MENMNTIYLRRKNKVIVNAGNDSISLVYLATFLKNLEDLGYTLSNELLERVSTMSLKNLVSFYDQLISDLKVMVGHHVKHNPMYPNFPQQVMDMSEAELYFNAMVHYFGDFVGMRLMPHTDIKDREPITEDTKLKVINLGNKKDFESIFTNLVASNTSLSETDKSDVEWFIKVLADSQRNLIGKLMPKNVPLRENVALVASLLMKHGEEVSSFLAENIKTATDVLRFAVHLSDGDISLAKPTKFRNFKRKERRILLQALNSCNNIAEDMVRYREMWKRLGEKLHPFEYGSKYSNATKAFKILFNKEKCLTFNARVEQAITDFKIEEVVQLLKSRPGEYARRLDNLVRLSDNPQQVISIFAEIAQKVSTTVLLQVKAHFANRTASSKNKVRTFFPKGNIAKVQAVDNNLQRINPKHCNNIVKICDETLKNRFAKEPSLGKVYIDDKIKGFNVPFSQRSTSKTLRVIPRGSRYDLAEGDTIRFFIHWKDIENGKYRHDRVDVDLSAVCIDEEYNYIQHISYTNLKELGCYHSGDITSAPDGASEFIDISITKCLNRGIRYIVMSVNSYTRQLFCDIPECFAGVMMRQKPQSGEIFEPRTVDNRVDLTAENIVCIPMIIDLQERQIIWADLGLKANPKYWNNVQGNMKGLQLMAKALTTMKKPNLQDLLMLHAEARGEIVKNIEEADTIFSIDKGITPFDTDVIVSEYIK